jgi:DNA-binding CsgD family transcriptional regulator
MSRLVTLADRWDAEPVGPDQIERLLDEIDGARAEIAHALPSRPVLAARRVSASLERVQAGQTLADIVRLAPAELCWAGDFDRVLLSRIDGSTWIPEAWHAAADASAEHTVVAPVIAGDRVVGLLHADARASGRSLDECDRITVRAFADGLGLVLERLALLDRLATQRQQISAVLAAAEQAVDELTNAPVTFTAQRPIEHELTPAGETSLDRLLTAREREVMAVLVSGATNAEIADRLTVSETTVKSHVKHILRKLRATNRAEAIARYLAMSGRAGSNPRVPQPRIPSRHGS